VQSCGKCCQCFSTSDFIASLTSTNSKALALHTQWLETKSKSNNERKASRDVLDRENEHRDAGMTQAKKRDYDENDERQYAIFTHKLLLWKSV
jgi:hypothetical protein